MDQQGNEQGQTVASVCTHEDFEAEVDVNRLTEKEGGNVSSFHADIRIKCAKCATPMHFVGVDQGLSFARPMASADGLELRAPLGVGPLIATKVQRFEVPAEQLEDAKQDDPILASSDDREFDFPNAADSKASLPVPLSELSDAEFEKRAAAELTKEEPPNEQSR